MRRLGIGVDDERNLSGQVIDHRQLFGQQQQYLGDIGELAAGRGRRRCKPRLDMPHRVVGEVASEPAAEAGQSGHRCGAIPALEPGNEIERVAGVALGNALAVIHLDVATTRTDARRRGQAYERIAAETLAADNRLEQERERAVRELDVERKRGIEVGERLEDEWDAVIALRGQRAEFGFGHDASTVLSTCATDSRDVAWARDASASYERRQQRQSSPSAQVTWGRGLRSRALKLIAVQITKSARSRFSRRNRSQYSIVRWGLPTTPRRLPRAGRCGPTGDAAGSRRGLLAGSTHAKLTASAASVDSPTRDPRAIRAGRLATLRAHAASAARIAAIV